MAVASMTDANTPTRPAGPSRGIGILTIATGVAAFALLANHPGGGAHDFAGVLADEAANRTMDAVVHGGFIVVLALQVICYAVLSARLAWQRTAVIAGFAFFAIGAAFLAASMLIDGLVQPAVAARYLAAPTKLEFAKALFVLMGTMVSFLMPIGLAFQGAAIAAWGWALAATGRRVAGLFGLALGLAMLAALAFGFAAMNPLVLMGAIVGTSLWTLVAGATLLQTRA